MQRQKLSPILFQGEGWFAGRAASTQRSKTGSSFYPTHPEKSITEIRPEIMEMSLRFTAIFMLCFYQDNIFQRGSNFWSTHCRPVSQLLEANYCFFSCRKLPILLNRCGSPTSNPHAHKWSKWMRSRQTDRQTDRQTGREHYYTQILADLGRKKRK